MTVLSDLAVEAETRTEGYAAASNACAEAESDYHRAYYTALAKSNESSVAGREREAEAACVDEKVALIHAQAGEKIAKQSVTTCLARLSAAQSYVKFVRDQT